MTAGLDLRHEGQAAVIAADTAPHRSFKDYIRGALDELIGAGHDFDVDAVRVVATYAARRDGIEFEPHSPNLIPAVLGGDVTAGRIVRVSDYHSGRKSRRYGRNGVYRAAN